MRPFIIAAPLLALGAFLYGLVLTRPTAFLGDGRFAPLLLIAALGLLLAALAVARQRSGAGGTDWRRALWLLLPAAVGWLLPLPEATAAVVYIGWDAQETAQLYKATLDAAEPRPLTTLPPGQNVRDFAVAPSGDLIAYTVAHANGSSDIWTIDTDGRLPYPLLDCLGAACSQPTWAADGARLVYERRRVVDGRIELETPQLWWLDAPTGDTRPVFPDGETLGLGAQFSPNGRWLSFLSPGQQTINLLNLSTEKITPIVSKTGEPGSWHPTADIFYYTNIVFQGEGVLTHLFAADLTAARIDDLSGQSVAVSDSSPVLSPDGAWLAFTRKPARTPSGRQIWLAQPNGSKPRSLTSVPSINHGLPRWSPDGRTLAFQFFDTEQQMAEPAIWLYDLVAETQRPLAAVGIQPQWVPR